MIAWLIADGEDDIYFYCPTLALDIEIRNSKCNFLDLLRAWVAHSSIVQLPFLRPFFEFVMW